MVKKVLLGLMNVKKVSSMKWAVSELRQKASQLARSARGRCSCRTVLLLVAGGATLGLLRASGLPYLVDCSTARHRAHSGGGAGYDTAQKFHVLREYVAARRTSSEDNITLCTHGDYAHLDNVLELAERWRGPISVAVYAPGDDLGPTIDAIAQCRSCLSPLVAELVTFHVFFDRVGVKVGSIPHGTLVAARVANCSATPPWSKAYPHQSYRSKLGLQYPVNVARNIARYAAGTHYVLVCDIEMYPSDNIVPWFLHMVRRLPEQRAGARPRVHVLPAFEVRRGHTAPRSKEQLVKLLRRRQAMPFHQLLCPECHLVPNLRLWTLARQREGLAVAAVVSRQGAFKHWEPVYIGTKQEPRYDERFTWEGQRDRMVQAFELCALCYEFHVLDNAFVVHRPGVKKFNKDRDRSVHVYQTKKMVDSRVRPEVTRKYPVSQHCYL